MIVCCGEALIDFLPRPGGLYQPLTGGSTANTAIALARLGVPSAFYSGLSTDFFGDSLKQWLKASKVDLKYVKFWDKPSTLAFVKFENGHARYSFFDDNSASRMLTKKDLPKLAADVTVLHFGSISLIPEPGGGTLEAFIKREAARRVISLDPNIRPSVVKDRRLYLARLNRLIPLCDIVKASDEDVKWLTGKDDLTGAARKWLKAGAKIVAITKGGNGAEAFTKRFDISLPAARVKIADTVGAGDTFTAGLFTALTKAKRLTKPALATIGEDALREAVAFAIRAAAITCSRPGADPPWAKELL